MRKIVFMFLMMLMLMTSMRALASSYHNLRHDDVVTSYEESLYNVKFIEAKMKLDNPYDDGNSCYLKFKFKNTTDHSVGIHEGDTDGKARWNIKVGVDIEVYDNDGGYKHDKSMNSYLHWLNRGNYTYNDYDSDAGEFYIKNLYQDADETTTLEFKFKMDGFYPKAKITGYIEVDDYYETLGFVQNFILPC